MVQVTKKTVIVQKEEPDTVSYLIYFMLGVLEFLLIFRLIFKVTGANPGSWFVSIIYMLSQYLILPFEGIFHRALSQGVETTAILEPSTIVAMIVYAILAWGVIWLISILRGDTVE